MKGINRDIFRPVCSYLREKYSIKGIGSIDSVEQAETALKKMYRIILDQEENKEKEELYSKNTELSKKIHSLEMELDKYRRKKEKYSKEFEDLKREHSNSVKSNIMLSTKIEEMKNNIIVQKDEIISLQKENLKLKDKLFRLKKELENSECFRMDFLEINNEVEAPPINLKRLKENIEDKTHKSESKIKNKKNLFERVLEKLFS